MSISLPIAKWLEGHAGMQGVAVMFLDSHRKVFKYIAQFARFAGCCTRLAFLISIPKIVKSLPSYRRSVINITSYGKRLGSSCHTLNFCPNVVQYRYRNMNQEVSLT